MKRWIIIRHIRWAWASWNEHRWARMIGRDGYGTGYPEAGKIVKLRRIWEGRE